MDKFLAEYGQSSFKDLLGKQAKAVRAEPSAGPSAGPSFVPPASKARRAEPSIVPPAAGKARPVPEPGGAPPAKKARPTAEPSAVAPTSRAQPEAVHSSADEAAAPVAKKAIAVPSGAEVQAPPAEEADIAQVKAKALRLYRAAHDSCREAAKADGERSGDPKVSDICCNVAEAQFASEFDIRWQDRGPRGSDAPSTWKGQRWREGSGRYGNRGGNPEKNKWYAEQAKLKAKGKGKSKGTDKGNNKGNNKGTGTSSPSSGADTGI